MANLSTQNIGTNFKGMLNLGSTINTPLSTTLQAITDGDGNTTPLQLATNRIALGTSTGTSLLNFPDAGTTAADGIQFGSGNSNLYRSASNILNTDGQFRVYGILNAIGGILNTTTGILTISSGAMTVNALNGLTSLTPPTLTGSSATSALSITQTWNTTGNPTAIFANITTTASGANANLMDLQVGGVSRARIGKGGELQISGYITFGVSGARIGGSGTDILTLRDNGGTTFNRLCFGGTTSSFPSIKRSGANFELKLADDSDYTSFQDKYNRIGSGSPEGVVTAPIGAIYHNTTGGAGTSFYVKESGTGNTGWVAK